MFRRMDDFLNAYDSLREGTGKMMDIMTDEMLVRRVAEGHRTLGGMAWHITTTIPEMMKQVGLGLSSVDAEAPPPGSAKEIADAYRKVSAELAAALREKWSDDTLEIEDDLYGQKFARGKTLAAVLSHETHHRGQMTVLLRQAGAVVPGLFGPAKEEWEGYGKEPPPY
ncbi:MAG: DinB family protein [Candidatus Eisenbacteria bacterium]